MPEISIIADVTFSTEGMVVITGLIGSLAGVVGYLFRLLYAGMMADRDSWRQMYFKAMEFTELLATQNRALAGRPAPPQIAAVVPEQSSPPTRQQIQTADIATERAKLAAVEKEIGQWCEKGDIP